MSDKIHVTFKECSKTLAVPASAAGKKIRCPACKGVVTVPGTKASRPASPAPKPPPAPRPKRKRPKRQPPPEPAYDDFSDLGDDPYADDPYSNSGAYGGGGLPPKRKKKKKSKKPKLAAGHDPYAPPPVESRMRQVGDDDELTAADILICILCSNIGCIVGIVRMCTGRSSSGGKMILIAMAMQFVWGAIGIALRIAEGR